MEEICLNANPQKWGKKTPSSVFPFPPIYLETVRPLEIHQVERMTIPPTLLFDKFPYIQSFFSRRMFGYELGLGFWVFCFVFFCWFVFPELWLSSKQEDNSNS